MAKSSNFEDIRRDILAGDFQPVYLLHGEESYYIDRITDLLLERVLTDEEKDFNLTQLYASDVNRQGTLAEVITACRRYPMMAERQLVMLREVQLLERSINIDDLSYYLEQPSASTVFVVTCKGKSFDARKKVYKLFADKGVCMESKKIRSYELPKVVLGELRSQGYTIEEKALTALCESVGEDLSLVFSEVAKLELSIKGKNITLDDVSSHIGVSKEYNNWELQSAIAARDLARIERIRQYFEKNPKNNPLVVTLSMLFSFFSNLMLSYYCHDKSERGLMAEIGCSYPAARDLKAAQRWCNAWHTMSNISLIREYDAQAKGARSVTGGKDYELLAELLYKLTH